MNLESHQTAAVQQWFAEGATLSHIQTRLKSEFGLTFTYLDVRLLAEKLKLTRDEEEKPNPSPMETPTVLTSSPASLSGNGNGKVSVSMDNVQRPGTLLSGKVIFSDAQSADWYIDQTGRLTLNPTQPGYRPSQSDIIAFQAELEKLARSHGA